MLTDSYRHAALQGPFLFYDVFFHTHADNDSCRNAALQGSFLFYDVFFHAHADNDSHRHAALQGPVLFLLRFLTHVDSDSRRL